MEWWIIDTIIKTIAAALDISEDVIELTVPKRNNHGDYATNIALKMAKSKSKSPLDLCEMIKNEIIKLEIIDKVEIVSPGFINMFIKENNIIVEYINKLDNIKLPSAKGGTVLSYNCIGNNLKDFRCLCYLNSLGNVLSHLGQDVDYNIDFKDNTDLIHLFPEFKSSNTNGYREVQILSGAVMIENAEIKVDFKLNQLIDKIGINRLRLDFIIPNIKEDITVEIMDDRLLYIAYPLRRIEIISERFSRENREIEDIHDLNIDFIDKEQILLLKQLSLYEAPIVETVDKVDLKPMVEYLIDITKQFYRINNNTQLRNLSDDELSLLLSIYQYFKKITNIYMNRLGIDIGVVYS